VCGIPLVIQSAQLWRLYQSSTIAAGAPQSADHADFTLDTPEDTISTVGTVSSGEEWHAQHESMKDDPDHLATTMPRINKQHIHPKALSLVNSLSHGQCHCWRCKQLPSVQLLRLGRERQ